MAVTAVFVDDHHLRVADEWFHCAYPHPPGGPPAGHLPVLKNRVLTQRTIDLCAEVVPTTIVELGIHLGGSTALLAELARPERVVAVELATAPAEALADYVDRRGLEDVIRPHYGVDQADRERLHAIVADDLDGGPVDLVVDDASHFLTPTRASFEALFPFVRPGGRYVIEDWNWQQRRYDRVRAALEHADASRLEAAIAARLADPDAPDHAIVSRQVAAAMAAGAAAPVGRSSVDGPVSGDGAAPPHRPTAAEVEPLVRLVFELVLAQASSPGAVARVEIDDEWVTVHRGPAPLDPATFRLGQLYHDDFALLGP